MPGWWEREDRFSHEPTATRRTPVRAADSTLRLRAGDVQPVLITGKTGTLGQMFARACDLRGLPYVLTDRSTMAIDDPASVGAALDRLEPSAIINTAGVACIERAEADPAACLRINAVGSEILARACEERGLGFVTFSSDQVFDGSKGQPYSEGDTPSPVNTYGRSKADAERRVLDAMGSPLIVRTAAFFSPHDPHNFAAKLLNSLRRGTPFAASAEHYVSPTYVPDLVHAVLDLMIDGETGIWHLANQGRVSWAEFAHALAEAADLDSGLIERAPPSRLGWQAPRPGDTTLTSGRGQMMTGLDAAIERFVAAYRPRADGPRHGRTLDQHAVGPAE
jgi:dTDP-4-dehydrorhamnose reductase